MAGKKSEGTNANLLALGTDLGSKIRINFNNFNSFPFCLVTDKVLQLEETPIMQNFIEPFSFSLLPNPFKIFHNYSVSISANNLFAYVVVYPSHKTSFFARDFFEQSSGRFSAFGLKFRTQISEFSFNLLYLTTSEKSFIRANSNVINSQINSNFGIILPDGKIFFKDKHKESPAFSVNFQETFRNIPISEIFNIAIRNFDLKLLPSFDCGNAQNIIFERGISWKVIADSTSINDRFAFCLFDNPTGLFNAGNRKLARKSDRLQMPVNKGMEFNIIPDFIMPSNVNAELQSFFIELQSLDYFRSCANLDFSCYINHFAVEKEQNIYKSNEDWQFLSTLKSGVSLPMML